VTLEQPQHLPKLRDIYAERVWPCGEWAKPRPSQFLCFCDHPSRVDASAEWDGVESMAAWEQRTRQLQTDGHRHSITADYVLKAWSRPGIYVLVDSQDRQPRYVGQSINLRARLNSWAVGSGGAGRVSQWIKDPTKTTLVWTPWLPIQGWSRKRGRTRMGSPARRWDVRVEPWLVEQLVRAEARAIAHFRAQGAPLLNAQLREGLLGV
jgi:hypothetical protein